MLVVSAGAIFSCARQLIALVMAGMQISAAANMIFCVFFMLLIDLVNVLTFDYQSVVCGKYTFRKFGCQYFVRRELMGQMGEP